MRTFLEIPLGPTPRTLTVQLGPTAYTLRLGYADTPEGGWFIDIGDAAGTPIVCGVPFVTGADLLGQYAYLGFPGRLWVVTDGDPAQPVGFDDLGTVAHLLFEPTP